MTTVELRSLLRQQAAPTVHVYKLLLMSIVTTYGVVCQEAAACPDSCSCSYTHMACEGVIPPDIPESVRNVELYGVYYALYSADPPFNSSRWSNVAALRICADELRNGTTLDQRKFTLQPKTFHSLKSLKHLSFKSKMLESMKPSVFTGLANLESLDFKGNINLRIEDFVAGLKGHDMVGLKSLHLCNISQSRGVANYFGSDFFRYLSTTKLELLDLSYIDNGLMDTQSFATSLPFLNEIVFEHSGYLGISIFKSNIDHSAGVVYKTLRKININYPTIPESIVDAASLLQTNTYLGYDTVPNNFTTVRARGNVPKSMPAFIFSGNFSKCLPVDMGFSQASVNWTIFCLPFADDGNLYLEYLDIAENELEFIDPSLTLKASRLYFLDISYNRLFKMEDKDFENLFQSTNLLETLVMSHNQLLKIPFYTFSRLNNLVTLDLSFNNLQHIDFDFHGLNNLQKIDLSYNNIVSLDSSARGRIEKMVFNYEALHVNDSRKLEILLHHNPLECSCTTVDFEEWLLKLKPECNFGDVTCFYKESIVVIDEDVYEESEYECKLVTIYAVTGSISGVIFIIIVLLLVRVFIKCRQKVKQQRLESMISRYKETCTSPGTRKVPVFLSYSGEEGDFVETNILTQMNGTLQSLLRTSAVCVTTGDSSFRLGKYVADEIIRCIEESQVIVACISQSFCKSHWCKNEILVSQMEHKPLLLLFLEHVDTSKMPKTLRRHFRKTTRGKVIRDESGQVSFQPDIENICESILQLMTNNESDTHV